MMPGRLLPLVLSAAMAVVRSTIDLETAATRVQQQVKGRVLGGKTVTEDERTIHVIRVLTPQGRVRHIRVDAANGRILGEPFPPVK